MCVGFSPKRKLSTSKRAQVKLKYEYEYEYECVCKCEYAGFCVQPAWKKQIEETHVSRAGWTKVNGHSTKTFCQNIKAAGYCTQSGSLDLSFLSGKK